MFIFCISSIILLNGCAVWKDLNTPVRKSKKTIQASKPKPYEPQTLPDGSTVGLNSYEKAYIDGLNKDFKRREQLNARKVFGTSKR